MTTIAAAPNRQPVIAAAATPNISNAPAKVTRPFAICSQDMPDNAFNDKLNTNNAPAIIPIPIAVIAIDFGINAAETPSISNAPAMLVNPLAISSHDKELRDFTAADSINIAPDNIVIPIAVDISPLDAVPNFANNANSVSINPIPTNPCCNAPKSISPNDLTAFARIVNAPAIINILAALDKPTLAPSITLLNAAISAITAPIPTNPCTNALGSN